MISAKTNESTSMPTSRRENPVVGVFSSASDVAGDFIELAELQVKLVRADIKAALNRSMMPLVLLVSGVVIGIAALPALTIGLSQWLATVTELSPWGAQLLVGLSAVLLALMLILIAVWRMRSAVAQLSTSSAELAKNVAWLKEVVRGTPKH